MKLLVAIAAAMLPATTPAAAQETGQTQQARLLDLSRPETVVSATREAGFRADLKTNADGEHYIVSATNGAEFSINFYGCGDKGDCPSLQFRSHYDTDPLFDTALANEWNRTRRFLKVAIGEDGGLREYMDFSVTGRVTYANFADTLDWYRVMDSELSNFLAEKRAAADKQ